MRKFLPAALFLLALLPALSYAQGDITTPADLKKIPYSPALTTKFMYPAHLSLSQYTAPAGEQGTYSTCTAWSMAMARSICYAYKKGITNKDSLKKYFFSPAFLYYNIRNKKDTNCTQGSRISDALLSLKEKGIVWQQVQSEACSRNVDPALYKDALKFRIKGGEQLNLAQGLTQVTIMKIKRALYFRHPVVISIGYFNSFTKVGASGIWHPDPGDDSATSEGHAMCITGYNDAVNGGAFEIVNSWGTSWGDQGHAWLSYEQLKKYGKYAIEITDYPDKAFPVDVSMELRLPDKSTLQLIRNNKSPSAGERHILNTINHYSVQNHFEDTLKFRLTFYCNTPGYLYLFTYNEEGRPYLLFPATPGVHELIQPEADKPFIWPQKGKLIGISPGDESRIWVVFSPSRLEVSRFSQVINRPLPDDTQLITLLQQKCIPMDNIIADTESASFRTSFASGAAVCFSILINTH